MILVFDEKIHVILFETYPILSSWKFTGRIYFSESVGVPLQKNVTTCTTLAMNFDEDLWEKAKTSHIEPEYTSWFFSLDTPEKISILNYKSSRVLLVTRRAFLELAVFDTIAAFWESLPKPLHEATRILISYHKLLRKEVTADLLTHAPDGLTKCPPLLHPWLRRTLCLLGHDEGARRVFETFSYPTHLLDEGVFSVSLEIFHAYSYQL